MESAIEGLDLRLEQRNALLPGLVSAAENSPQLDPDAVEQLKAARDAMTSAVTMDEKIAADERLSQAVLYLLALPGGRRNYRGNVPASDNVAEADGCGDPDGGCPQKL